MKTPLSQIRIYTAGFMLLLILSGITAFPLQSEMNFLLRHLSAFPSFMQNWIRTVAGHLAQSPAIMFYGTDWLAFAHLVIALFYIPVYIDPLKHRLNLVVGMIACLGVFPLAFICGPIRGIPFFHQLIDCSFGAGGLLLLGMIHKNLKHLERREAHAIA